MSSSLLDALYQLGGGILNVLDMPGSYTRGLLAGRPGDRLSGRDMLEQWGVLDPNQEGLDAGDVAGFGADVLVDPLNLIGGTKAISLIKNMKPKIPVSVISGVDDGYAIAKTIGKKGDELGNVTLMPPSLSETGAAVRGFPDVVPEGSLVARVEGSMLDDTLHGRGVGQQMYVDAMNASPSEWFYNSGNSDAATRAIEALSRKGLADVHWQRRLGGPRVMRITDEGRKIAGTNGLIRDPKRSGIAPLLLALLGYNTANAIN